MWCGYCVSSSITAVRWKYNKIMNVISTFIGKQHYCHREKRRVNIEQPNIIKQCHMSKGGGGVDCMNQNISAYMINLRKKKWWW